jgi:hypothetical protein
MKKIFFASLMVLVLGGVSYSQTTPAKASSTQKKEAVKPASSVSSAAPVKNTKSNAAVTKTNATRTSRPKPVATSTTSDQASSQAGKHKKARHIAKKQK